MIPIQNDSRVITLDGDKGLIHEHIEQLTLNTGEILALVLRGFTSPEEREKIIQNINTVGLDDFSGKTKEGTQVVSKPRIGVNVFHHIENKSGYFAGLQSARQKFDAIFQNVGNPVNHLMATLARACNKQTVRPIEDGQELAPFVIRALAEAPVHNDDIRYEALQWLFHRSHRSQIAHNTYLVSPEGSDLMIFPTRDIDSARKGMVSPVMIHPESGDTVLFNSTIPHAVSRGEKSGESRLSVSGFLAPTTDGKIHFWV